MVTTETRRWTAPPPLEELLTLPEVVAYLGLDPTNTEHVNHVDQLLFEPDTPEDEVERWMVGSIRAWMLDPAFPDLPGDQDVIDLAGIADYLQVATTTPQQWRQREKLEPEDPETSFADKPTWRRRSIRRWALTSEPLRWPPGVASRKQA